MRCQYVLKQFSPDKMLNTPFGITAAQLRKMGKTTILTDLDNTLLAWDQLDATDEVINWFTILKEEGIKVMIFLTITKNELLVWQKQLMFLI